MPHLTHDPVSTSAKIINELQTLVSRETDPLDSAVVSITAIHGGQAANVIPPSVEMLGTIRSLSMPGLQHLQKRIREVVTHITDAHHCEATIDFPGNDYPPTINDPVCWSTGKNVAADLFGSEHVEEVAPIMGGEDFAYYTEQIPGCFIGLGVYNESEGATYMVHHPKFKVDEQALPLGTALHVAYAFRSLDELQS